MAVKKVQRAFGNLTDAKRVLREVKLLRAFHHENIINLLDLVPPPYLVEAVASQRPQGKVGRIHLVGGSKKTCLRMRWLRRVHASHPFL